MYTVEYILNGNYNQEIGFESVDAAYDWAEDQGMVHRSSPENEKEFRVIK